MKNIIAIVGSAAAASSSHKIVEFLKTLLDDEIRLLVFDRLKELPHFDPTESTERPPIEIIALRQIIQDADAVLICSPEYIFSIPSGLKIFWNGLLLPPYGWINRSLLSRLPQMENIRISNFSCYYAH